MKKKPTVFIDGAEYVERHSEKIETVCGLTVDSIAFLATFYYANGGKFNDPVAEVKKLFERVTIKPV